MLYRTILFILSLAATTRALSSQNVLPSGASSDSPFFLDSRREILNLLHHPLQLQIATGELPLGSFRRLVLDRGVILDGLLRATPAELLDEEVVAHANFSRQWLAAAEAAGKTITDEDDVEYYNRGENYLNTDCPNDMQISSSALALKSVLESHGVVGASAVLRCYGFACARLLEAYNDDVTGVFDIDTAYHGWLEAHAVRWTALATVCEGYMDCQEAAASSSYEICLSMLYNWIDSEAATTGIRSSGLAMASLTDAIEALEPGYAAQRDKHQSFVADITGVKDMEAKKDAAKKKVNAAAAYLAAKKKKESKE